VLYAYLYGIVLFHDRPSLAGLSGTLLIALGLACVTRRAGPIQASTKSDAARDVAGAGYGSRVFTVSAEMAALRDSTADCGSGMTRTDTKAGAEEEGVTLLRIDELQPAPHERPSSLR
jgi:hypothetical protein